MLWMQQKSECIKTLEGHRLPVLCLKLLPNSKSLASGSKDDTIKI
jgi:WD40 repeat protein